MKKSEIVELGDQVEDTVTGFKGTVVAITNWLHQCSRVTIQPKVDKDGKLPEAMTFDVPSMKIIKKAAKPLDHTPEVQQKRNGGSQNDKQALRRN